MSLHLSPSPRRRPAMGACSLPHLEHAGSGAVRSMAGGFEVYRVEVTP
ncbi:MAG: hypothetical protein ABI333_12425 [bacterium]